MPDLLTLLLLGIFVAIIIAVILLIRNFGRGKSNEQWQRIVGGGSGVNNGHSAHQIGGSESGSRIKFGMTGFAGGMTNPNNNESRTLNSEQNSTQAIDMSAFDSEYRARMDRATANFEKSLSDSLKTLQSGMLQNMNQVQKMHGQFLANLEEMASTEQNNSMQQVSTKINELLLNFEQNLTGFLSSSEQKSLEAINLEVRSARQLIDGYKTQQLAIVDENIVSVLEKTMELVLKEKLTLKNQVDLVYDALERAKVEKFFV